MLRLLLQLSYLLAVGVSFQVQAGEYDQGCLPLKIEGKHGPFDYRSADLAARKLVEKPHFDEHYQAYRLGKKKFRKQYDSIIETPAAGFGYTLWAFPNHHVALAAIENLGDKQRTDKLDGLPLRVRCYFERAVKFVPDDGLVRALYGYYYGRRGDPARAEMQISAAIDLRPDDVNVRLYTATAYLELGLPDKAVEHVEAAYALGYPFPGLRQRLDKARQSHN